MKNIALSSERKVLFTPQAAGSTTLTSPILDMQGFDSVLFETLIGALTAAQTKGTIQVNAGNLANGSDMAPLGGATITIADADTGKLEAIEVLKPVAYRYLELVITRNTQAAAISSVVATMFGARKQPTSDDASVAQTYCVIDPEYVNADLTITTAQYGDSTTFVVTTSRNAS